MDSSALVAYVKHERLVIDVRESFVILVVQLNKLGSSTSIVCTFSSFAALDA